MATLNDSNTKQLQELVTCAICLDHYQDPRLLPCSHTFCLNCIRQLVKNGQFDCPLRDNTTINQNDINTLPINRTAKDMVEFLLSMDVSTGRKTSHLCDNCNENQAVHWCDKCAAHYCELCTKSVHSIKALQSHTVVPLTDKIQSFCTDHSDEKLKYWCSRCENLVCRDCLLFKHKEHPFLPLKDAATEAKAKFQEGIQETEEIKGNLTKLSDKTKSITNQQRQTAEEQKQDIEQTLAYLQRRLEERKCSLIKQLEDQGLETMNMLDQQQTIIDQHLNLSIIQEIYIRKMLESNDPMQILKFKSTLSHNYKDFTEQYRKIDEGYTRMSHTFEKDDKDLQQISEKISRFGNINSKSHEVKRDDFKAKTSELDISKPGGETEFTRCTGYARGYKFSLKQPLKLRWIRIRSDCIGQLVGFVVNDDNVVIENGTINSDDSTMKWLTIPLKCDIKNNFTVFVYALSGNGSYTYKPGDSKLRVVNQNCSVESKSVSDIPQTSIGSKISIRRNSYSIDMILNIEE
jgi:tripartite motif-containing protein 56